MAMSRLLSYEQNKLRDTVCTFHEEIGLEAIVGRFLRKNKVVGRIVVRIVETAITWCSE